MGIEKIGVIDVADDIDLVRDKRSEVFKVVAELEFQADLREVILSHRPGDHEVYDIVLKNADRPEFTKSYSADMARNIVHVSREGDKYLEHAIGLAEKCQLAGLGNFCVVKYPKA